MEFVEITYGSADYQAALTLRHNLLRRPLGLDLYAENLEREQNEWHFGLKDKGTLVASVTLRPEATGCVRLRQMVVASTHQGHGLGRHLVEQIEPLLRERGITEIQLHARCKAEGFYARLGYQRVGDEFEEVGIQHVAMRKCLK